MKDHLLRDMTRPFLWAMDEVDRLFASDFGGDVFGLFRSWHNGRSIDPLGPWSRLTLAIAYATEAHLFIKDLNQSPFNVGTLVSLSDLTLDELEELNRRRLTDWRRGGAASILDLSRGPSVHCKPGAFRDEKASSRSGVFRADCDTRGWPLWRTFAPLKVALTKDPVLTGVVVDMLRGRPCSSSESFYRLRTSGVVTGGSPQTARCVRLYANYLGRHLK